MSVVKSIIRLCESFKKGDFVVIKKEYRDKNETDEPYVIVEWNGDRGYISPIHWKHGPLVPRELVRGFQIEKVNFDGKR